MKTLTVFSALLAATLFPLGSCTMVGPDYERPEAAVNESWSEVGQGPFKGAPSDLKEWWHALGDPVLDDLVARAFEQNLTVQQAAVRILESRAVRAVAVGFQYPQTQELSGGYERVELSRNAPNSGAADHAFGNYVLGFDAGWEMDVWGRFGRGIEAATAELQADVAAYDDLVVSLAAEVAAAYVDLRTLQVRLGFARANVRIQEESLRLAESRFRNGQTSELDVTQARALLNSTRALVPDLQARLRQVRNSLCVLLGIPPTELDLQGEPRIPSAPAEVAVGMPSDLLRRRPDVRRAERLAAAQCARIGIAEADLYPAFSLLGSLGLQTGDSGSFTTRGDDIGDLFSSDAFTGLFGVGFRWPIFNYGRLKNNVRAQDAAFQQLILNYQNTVLQAAAEVETSMTAFLRTLEQAHHLEESVKASERSVELSLLQYREGVVDYQRVLDSQDQLATSQDEQARVQGAALLNLIAMYKALGGGWEVRRVKDFVPESIQEEMRRRVDWDGWLPADAPEGEFSPGG